MSLERFDVRLPRHAFGPREAARAGDLWRLLQEVAILGSIRRGWPPERYREEGCAFVVRAMTVVHHRETMFGEPLQARTWVTNFRRGMFSDRQIRIGTADGPVTGATQRWVHVAMPDLKPSRAPQALQDAFVLHDLEPDVAMPEVAEALEGPEHPFAFQAWHTWMDPLAHANHPAYVDWADEAACRVLASQGLDPQGLVAVAEQVIFRSGVTAPEPVTVHTRLTGLTSDGDVVLTHRVLGGDARLCAEITTVRRHAEADLSRAFRAPPG